MKQISEEIILKSVEKINGLSDDALTELAQTYTLGQTELLSYAMQASEEYENEELAEYLIYYFCMICEMFHQAQCKLKRVDDAMIDAFHDEYLDVLEEYTAEEDLSILDPIINQPNVMAFIAEDLGSLDEEGEELDVETASQLFIVLTAVVGLLNRASC